MRLLVVFAFACLPLLLQSAPPARFAPRPTPKSTCDLSPSQRRSLANFDFCGTAQTPKPILPAPELAVVNPPKWSSVCSVPLLSVPAVETHDAMIVAAPPADGAFAVKAPAPPCEDWGKYAL